MSGQQATDGSHVLLQQQLIYYANTYDRDCTPYSDRSDLRGPRRTRRTGDWASQKGDMVAASDAANAARAAAVKAAKAVLRSAREAQGIDVEAEEKPAAEGESA